MKYILQALLVFTSTLGFGQSQKINELINQAYPEIVPSNFKYFNLIDSSNILRLDKYSLDTFNIEIRDFLKNNPDFSMPEFIEKSKVARKINWRDYSIKKSRIYSYDSIPKFESGFWRTITVPYNTSKKIFDSLEKKKEFDEIVIRVKANWNDDKIWEVATKKRKQDEMQIRKEDRRYFSFSTPLFSDDNKYAIIQLNKTSQGHCCIYKFQNNQWIKVLVFGGWVS